MLEAFFFLFFLAEGCQQQAKCECVEDFGAVQSQSWLLDLLRGLRVEMVVQAEVLHSSSLKAVSCSAFIGRRERDEAAMLKASRWLELIRLIKLRGMNALFHSADSLCGRPNGRSVTGRPVLPCRRRPASSAGWEEVIKAF